MPLSRIQEIMFGAVDSIKKKQKEVGKTREAKRRRKWQWQARSREKAAQELVEKRTGYHG